MRHLGGTTFQYERNNSNGGIMFFFFFVFCLFVVVAISWAAPAAYGDSQARG